MVRRILASSRFFLMVAVVGSFVASATAMLYGGITTVVITFWAFRDGDFSETAAKHLAVGLLTMTDLFLLGTVLYIVAIGLYELFIDTGLPMPSWLRITTLDDLKERLLGVVIVLLAVTFLGPAVTWDGSPNILALGGSIGLVLGALALVLWVLARGHRPDGHAAPDSTARDDHAPVPAQDDRLGVGPPSDA